MKTELICYICFNPARIIHEGNSICEHCFTEKRKWLSHLLSEQIKTLAAMTSVAEKVKPK